MDEIRSKNGARSEAVPAEPPAPSYRFALRPGWILSHLLAVFLVVLFVNLGMWQLRRLDERQDLNARVEVNVATAPAPLPVSLTEDQVEAFAWRPFVVEGTYRTDGDILVANRSLDGQPGYWVVTLLDPDDGSAPVPVVRGFVSRTLVSDDDLAAAAAPSGPVTVTGYAQESRGGGRFATSLPEGAAPEISRPDVAAMGERWGVEPAPLWLQLSEQAPANTDRVVLPVPLPDPDEGSHLSYAIQWFIFATIGAVGYVLILRRNARPGAANP